jgi:hypothetical protein
VPTEAGATTILRDAAAMPVETDRRDRREQKKLDAKARTGSSGQGETYTSTGVRAPWVMEQPKAPARAKREYRSMPVSFLGSAALTFWTTASSLVEPVDFESEAIVMD